MSKRPHPAFKYPGDAAIRQRRKRPRKWIKNLTTSLHKRGYDIKPTNEWSSEVARIVARFQRNHPKACGKADGIPGRRTWAAIFGRKSVGGRYPMLELASGAHWPTGSEGRALLTKLNNVGEDIHRKIRIISGKRIAYDQWRLYMLYLRGAGNLAAPCCWKRYIHSWESCGKACQSNHCRSRAVDCGTVDKWGNYASIGYSSAARSAMRAHGLCLPVVGEQWHVEVGSSWRV